MEFLNKFKYHHHTNLSRDQLQGFRELRELISNGSIRVSVSDKDATTYRPTTEKEFQAQSRRSNFLTVNVFFRDMSYMEYIQIQGTSLTETLSDIGGNMGMFLGMSVITVVEVLMYCSKIGWITFSKKRRNYMYQKHTHEKEHEKQLEETVSGFKWFRSRKYAGDMSNTKARIRALTSKVSFENDTDRISTSGRESEATERRSRFLSTNDGSYYNDNPDNRNSVVELKINLHDIENMRDGHMQIRADYRTKPRSSTAPPRPFFTLGAEEGKF
ncbi:hypothetical protein Y032_0011g1530 [Ancylostoma ceylanicum]|nr:hypothetical protein Y032_0011g1530 [Ancylostoma ceylanicum]